MRLNYISKRKYVIGQAALGGKIAYILQVGDPGYEIGTQHGLVATVADTSAGAEWGCKGTLITGANDTTIGTGNQNTIDIMTGCATAGIAARLCGDLSEGGYTDWYLPSKDELVKLFQNQNLIGGFTVGDYYWSSSQNDSNTAWEQNFRGGLHEADKESPFRVRAIRSF